MPELNAWKRPVSRNFQLQTRCAHTRYRYRIVCAENVWLKDVAATSMNFPDKTHVEEVHIENWVYYRARLSYSRPRLSRCESARIIEPSNQYNAQVPFVPFKDIKSYDTVAQYHYRDIPTIFRVSRTLESTTVACFYTRHSFPFSI